MHDVVILSGVRTAIGNFGGNLKAVAPSELGRIVISEAIKRAGIEPADVGHVVLGQVIQSEPRDAYLSRISAVAAGIPYRTPALMLNRLCGSGVQAIISAAQMIVLGECDIAVAGGVESMSQSPHVAKSVRWGCHVGDEILVDAMTAVLNDPFCADHVGMTAEFVADLHAITRGEQDALAFESHRRASRAQREERFREQIVPVEVNGRTTAFQFKIDEHVRPDISKAALAGLRPVFQEGGTVTAGNACGLSDGGAALVLASAATAQAKGLMPRARIAGWGHAGVAPEVMGLAPVDAVPIALDRAGISLDDIDVIEANEAFAAQACAVAKLLDFDAEKLNPNGGSIALGHPIGAAGAIMTIKALCELERTGGRYGLVTMCIAGGQGIAMIIERLRGENG